jgi:TonB family protein
MRVIGMATAVLLIATAALARERAASSPKKIILDEGQAYQLKLYAPQPEYPFEAQRRHITGSGIFRLRVQIQTGSVTAVEVGRSTGSAILDKSAVDACRRWRFKPPLLRQLQRRGDPSDTSAEIVLMLPVTFTM